ncbi:MAG: methyltransferase domain-containing protein [Henriciella sp.]|uniref:class I SAM-dependent methyltransferase n=1 Tax=Henriciella sp. TaxID=1968823 RepID=UPI003C71AD19
MKHFMGAAGLALMLAACSNGVASDEAPTEASSAEAPAEASYSLGDAMAGSWRTEAEVARDEYRHPVETLEFFGIEGDDTVVEIWPGGGWYTNILAPWLHANGGQFIAATFSPERNERASKVITDFKANYAENPDVFGDIQYTVFDRSAPPMGEPDSVDAVLTFRNVHGWMGGGYSDKFFTEAYRALKPGGVLGVVQHRLPSAVEQDPSAPTGYVHEDFIKTLATNAGFEFAGSSEINANPADTADHPFGVWTLPPVSRTEDSDGNTPDDFDPAAYEAIGESDRMTLKFVKPAE